MTPHFSLAELTVTSVRADNTPSKAAIDNLKVLAETILEPARKIIGKPMVITSGYRSPAVNKAVGGAENSQHMIGQAADFIVPGMSAREVCLLLKGSDLLYHQLIFENFNGGWTHISWSEAPRRQAFELPSGEGIVG